MSIVRPSKPCSGDQECGVSEGLVAGAHRVGTIEHPLPASRTAQHTHVRSEAHTSSRTCAVADGPCSEAVHCQSATHAVPQAPPPIRPLSPHLTLPPPIQPHPFAPSPAMGLRCPTPTDGCVREASRAAQHAAMAASTYIHVLDPTDIPRGQRLIEGGGIKEHRLPASRAAKQTHASVVRRTRRAAHAPCLAGHALRRCSLPKRHARRATGAATHAPSHPTSYGCPHPAPSPHHTAQ
jgi:hypothetical protein